MAHLTTISSQIPALEIIISSLRVFQLNIGEVRGCGDPGPMGRDFTGWRDRVGRVVVVLGGWW